MHDLLIVMDAMLKMRGGKNFQVISRFLSVVVLSPSKKSSIIFESLLIEILINQYAGFLHVKEGF